MPRSNRPRRGGSRRGASAQGRSSQGRSSRGRPAQAGEPRPLGNALAGMQRQESRGGREWLVRPVSGSSERTYRCPGCDQEIRPGTAHLVVWPADSWQGDDEALAQRRHWHTPCWGRGLSASR